jgi:hypothetical protein
MTSVVPVFFKVLRGGDFVPYYYIADLKGILPRLI